MFRRNWLALAACAAPVAALAVLAVGELLSRPVQRAIGTPPAALHGATVGFATTSGGTVAGWAADGAPGRGAVLLLHGVRSDRRQMLARALWLHGEGRAVLLIDLPSHGESAGERITFGARESAGVSAALQYMASRWPGEAIAVVGVSLGAASTVLAPALPGVKALVLESMYPTIDDALRNRLHRVLGAAGPPLAPLLLTQLPWRTGVRPDELRPIDRMAQLSAPVLVLGGELDRHTPPDETRQLRDRAGATAGLWIVAGAAHVDLHRHAPADYQMRVGAFLRQHLGPGRASTDS
ncbi:alpha/beta hydrolase [Xenophilus aerolatus]|nr:alpha/beta hydrolase [Xenophilus aerolatus]